MHQFFRSLRVRLVIWFTLGVIAVTAVFCVATYRHLYEELHDKQVATAYPDHPDWNLHGNSSSAEIQDIMNELMEVAAIYALPFLVLIILFGYFLAGKSLKPIAELNEQMAAITPTTINEPIISSARDTELQSLSQHLNDLLSRLAKSFEDIREYAAQVAHELRTPLTILRLKIEQADNEQIEPQLQEDIQDELRRLTHMVDQSLLIARSDKGSLKWNESQVDVSALVGEQVEDFRLLATESNRSLQTQISTNIIVHTDGSHLKQILHGLFANALKHGIGPITVRLCPKSKGRSVHFLVTNEVAASHDAPKAGLGLGLRVVNALINLQSGVCFQRHHGRRYYAARLVIPMAATAMYSI